MPQQRPFVARKNTPQTLFSAFTSCARLRHVQSLLRDAPVDQTSEEGLDAILCILGIDSRYNEGCREFANYLLFGFLDQKDELDRLEVDQDIAEDIIILVKRESVHIHYLPTDHAYIIPYIAHWRNLHQHCLTDAEYKENEETAENFKVISFIEMVQDCPRIGIPYFAQGHLQRFDFLAVERWPIIQAYGLEDFGMGGFFTMKHKVVDVSAPLARIYDVMDPVALENLVTVQLPLFERQWQALLTNVDVAFKERATFGELRESTVAEPVMSFYNHGRVSKSASENGSMKPSVSFGQHSSSTASPNADKTIATSGVNATAAKHMVCQAVAPRSPLCCGRTFFFGSGHTTYPVTGGTPRAPKPPKTDVELLSKLYKIAIDAVVASIRAYGQTASATEAEGVCKHTIREGCVDNMLNAKTYMARLEFTLEAFDHHGNGISLQEDKSLPLVKMASLRFTDIDSIEHGGNSLGSVLFSESFLDSRITVSLPGGGTSIDSQCLMLTSHVPRYVSWAVDVPETNSTRLIKTFTESADVFGKVLLNGETVVALGSKELSSPHEGKLYICERGIIFEDSRHGVVIFPKSYFEEMQFFDGDSSSVIATLIIVYRHSLQQYLPMQYHNEEDTVMFASTPKTKAHRAFYSEVISIWLKTTDEPLLKLAGKVPEYFAAPYTELQMQYTLANKLIVDARPISVAMANLHNLKNFLDHFAASSVGEAPVPARDLPCILNQEQGEETKEVTDNGEVVVTIITGIPGSHKDNLCNVLTNMAKEHSRWVTLRQPFDAPNTFNAETIQTSISAILTASKKRNVRAATGGRKKMRVLIDVPGFTDTVDVVRAVVCHPDTEVSQQVRIGAVTACIDPHNTFMSHRYTFPKLLDQCAQGWVNNVLFTNSTESPDPVLLAVQDLLRKVNPGLAFILASKGEISRSEDVDLILSESLFTKPSMVRARHLLSPGWTQGQFRSGVIYPAMTAVSLKFTQPLDRAKLLTKLRDLRDQISTTSPFTGSVYCVNGRTKFTDSDQLMEVQCVTLSSYISLTPVSEVAPIRPPAAPQSPTPQPSSPHQTGSPNSPASPDRFDGTGDNGYAYCMVFTGCGLVEETMKEWLRGCTRQKPAKKPLKTKHSLTKEELKKIHTKHHLDALPQGWFYNGSQYVSMAGEKTSTHPDMDKFITEYLGQANGIVEKYNARVESEVYKDLFA